MEIEKHCLGSERGPPKTPSHPFGSLRLLGKKRTWVSWYSFPFSFFANISGSGNAGELGFRHSKPELRKRVGPCRDLFG